MNKKTMIILAVAAGALLLMSQSSAGGGEIAPAMPGEPPPKMAAVGLNEKVSAQTYKLRKSRRSGYFYVPVTRTGKTIEFVSPVAGYFTRYVVKDATGRIFAEILKSA